MISLIFWILFIEIFVSFNFILDTTNTITNHHPNRFAPPIAHNQTSFLTVIFIHHVIIFIILQLSDLVSSSSDTFPSYSSATSSSPSASFDREWQSSSEQPRALGGCRHLCLHKRTLSSCAVSLWGFLCCDMIWSRAVLSFYCSFRYMPPIPNIIRPKLPHLLPPTPFLQHMLLIDIIPPFLFAAKDGTCSQVRKYGYIQRFKAIQ